MQILPETYEKLGTFYLGREYDIANKQLQDDLVLYDSKDLVTHGVVLGMTGSGKTGLCLALLEEAAMDGIPVIAIDPKGDIANFLLTFPELTGSSFEPWVNEEDARKKSMDIPQYAEAQASLWEKGLGEWGQSAERIRQLRSKVDVTVFTPGSSAGIPVSILASLAAPGEEVLEDHEIFNEKIQGAVTSLLSLAGVEGDPIQSPEHVFLANIFSQCWQHSQDVTLESLIQMVQNPPFKQIGVVSVNDFLPEKKRVDLAMKLNNLIASPSFATWLQGVPLDIQQMMYTPEGKPRVSIFSIAHLSDTERMFFVSLLLNQMLGWMRAQSGTTSLRGMLYMDEIFGYLPPTANPPSKKPMMILLKQARAFGLGILLATQNPVDLDYKALSNIGTWWLGRLQTERDKQRVLDGLEGAASSQNASFNRQDIEKLLSSLGNRVFLMNNVHEDHPVVFNVRWVMTYLRGPLSRNQLKSLMDPRREEFEKLMAPKRARKTMGAAMATSEGSSGETESLTGMKPSLPEGIEEFFDPEADLGVVYQPKVLRSAIVQIADTKRKISGKLTVTQVCPIDLRTGRMNWDQGEEVDFGTLDRNPVKEASYTPLPPNLQKSATWKSVGKDFVDWIYVHQEIEVVHSPLLDAYANLGESEADFRIRLTQNLREKRDSAVEELRAKLGKQAKSIEDKATRAMQKLDTQKAQSTSSMVSTAVTVGSSLLGMFFGRKGRGVSASSVSKVSSMMRENREAAIAEQEVERYRGELQALDQLLADETQKIRDQYDADALTFEKVKLQPMKKNITPQNVGVYWSA